MCGLFPQKQTPLKCLPNSSPRHVKLLLSPCTAQSRLRFPHHLFQFLIVVVPQRLQTTPLPLFLFTLSDHNSRPHLFRWPKPNTCKYTLNLSFSQRFFLRYLFTLFSIITSECENTVFTYPCTFKKRFNYGTAFNPITNLFCLHDYNTNKFDL